MFVWPHGEDDSALQQATFRLVAPADGRFLGTGFMATSDRLLTCHHVVACEDAVAAVDRSGRLWAVTVEGLEDPTLAAADMAILRFDDGAPEITPPPLCFREPGRVFSSRVQLPDRLAFEESTPIRGELLGPARIRYEHGGRAYSVEARAVADASIKSGMSGAASWDAEASAVCGIVAVSASDANFGGFVVPLARALGSPALGDLVDRNEKSVPRFGDRPNQLGLERMLSAANARTLTRLRTRDIISRTGFVPREGWVETVAAFFEADRDILCVVSSAGQGKTNVLAHLAESDQRPPVWLVRAADLAAQETPEAAIVRLFQEAGAPTGLTCASAAAGCARRPILLLDGLNEAPIDDYRLAREWFPDLLAWASAAGWRVIYTVRRELFDALQTPLRGVVFSLGRYTANEVKLAAAAYGFTGRRPEREPLLMRIQAEVGAGGSRAEALDRFVAHLLEKPSRGGSAGHPARLLQGLADLAARMGADGGGVARHDDPFFLDTALTHGLCEANVLEVVPSGYRFVFDEIADYLHARALADGLEAATIEDALSRRSANVVALTVEAVALHAEDRAAAMAVDIAQRVGSDGRHPVAAFLAISALSLNPAFERAKLIAAAAAAADENLRRVALVQPGLLAAFPLEGVKSLAYETILDQSGYGWREKDISSELHRPTTVSYARMDVGIFRLIYDLLDDAHVDGAELLIGWLQDATRLAHHGRRFANDEATVGTFVLCILFSYREKIGLERLFTQVVWACRPGYGALLTALAAEETEPFVRWLEGLDPAEVARRASWAANAWGEAHQALGRVDGASANQRVAAGLERLLPHASGRDLGTLVHLVVSLNLPVADASGQVRRALQAGLLDADCLAAAIGRGLVAAPVVFSSVDPKIRDQMIFALAGNWKPETPGPTLAELVQLIRTTSVWPRELTVEKYRLESLLWALGLDEAQGSGVDVLLREMMEADTGTYASFLVNTAFASGWSKTSDQQHLFRSWIAETILPFLKERGLTEAIERSLDSAAVFERCRPFALQLARRGLARDLAQVLFTPRNLHEDGLVEVLEAFFEQGRDLASAEIQLLRQALERLRARDKLGPLAVSELFDLASDHLLGR